MLRGDRLDEVGVMLYGAEAIVGRESGTFEG